MDPQLSIATGHVSAAATLREAETPRFAAVALGGLRALFLASLTALLLLVGVSDSAVGATPTGSTIVSLRQIQWSTLIYGDTCKANGFASAVQYVRYTESASGTPLAIVLVTCTLEDGTGPAALFVFDQAPMTGGVNLVATLLDSSDGWTPGEKARDGKRALLSVDPYRIELRAFSYEGNVARCCPNVFATLIWKWKHGSFVRIGRTPRHSAWGGPGRYTGY